MDSIVSLKEEVKFNSPVPAPNIINYYSSYTPFYTQVSNTAVEEAKGNVSGEWEGMEEVRNVVVL